MFEPRSGQHHPPALLNPPLVEKPSSATRLMMITRIARYSQQLDCQAPTRRTPAHRCPPLLLARDDPGEPEEVVTLEQGPSTPPGPPPPDRGGGGEGGRPPVGSGGGPSRRGGSAPPERYLPSPYIYPFSDFG